VAHRGYNHEKGKMGMFTVTIAGGLGKRRSMKRLRFRWTDREKRALVEEMKTQLLGSMRKEKNIENKL